MGLGAARGVSDTTVQWLKSCGLYQAMLKGENGGEERLLSLLPWLSEIPQDSTLIVGPCKEIFCLSTGSEAESKKIGIGGLPGDREASAGPSELCGCFPPL